MLYQLNNDTVQTNAIGGGKTTIDSVKEKIEIIVGKKVTRNINDGVHEALINIKAKNNSNNNVSQTSNLDEIAKLKQLLDMDAISQEEFDQKKQELLCN